MRLGEVSSTFLFGCQVEKYTVLPPRHHELHHCIATAISSGDTQKNIAKHLSIHCHTVANVYNAYQESGDIKDCPRSSRPEEVRAEALVDTVKVQISANPEPSIRALARELNMARTTMERVVKFDLGLKNLAKIKVQQITPSQCQKKGRERQRQPKVAQEGVSQNSPGVLK